MNRNEFKSYRTPKRVLQLQLTAAGVEGMHASLAENVSDSFITPDSSANGTQFFSVLETTTPGTILDDIGYEQLTVEGEPEFTFTNAVNGGAGNVQVEEDNSLNAELVIFKSPHSTKLFGLQTATDEEGNMQKYQYEVIQNEDGQYESIPGTIHLVPFETDPASVIQQMEAHQEQTELANNNESLETTDQKFNVKEKQFDLPIKVDNSSNVDDPVDELGNVNAAIYITGGLHEGEEVVSKESRENLDLEENLQQIHFEDQEGFHGLCLSLEEERSDDLQGQFKPGYEQGDELQDQSEIPVKRGILETALKGMYSPEKLEKPLLYVNQVVNAEGNTELTEAAGPKKFISLSKINGLGQRTIALYPVQETIMKSKKKVIMKTDLPRWPKPSKFVVRGGIAPLKTLNSLKRIHVAPTSLLSSQKENLESSDKSIVDMKSRQIRQTISKPTQLATIVTVAAAPTATSTSKTSQASEAAKMSIQEKEKEKKRGLPWNVNKMISQTKIIEAPVRSERLPRKQKIELRERLGEELVFQHVTVTANGMIETVVDGVVQEVKELKPSECIQLSDTEDDLTRKLRKASMKKKQIAIVISDSEEEVAPLENVKAKKADTENKRTKADEGKNSTNSCDVCGKVFVSVSSLKVHLQRHAAKQTSNEELTSKSKRECSICLKAFINPFLKNQHELMHKVRTKNECEVCKHLFQSAAELKTHRKQVHGVKTSAKKAFASMAVADGSSLRRSPRNLSKATPQVSKPTVLVGSSSTRRRSLRASTSGRRRSLIPQSKRKLAPVDATAKAPITSPTIFVVPPSPALTTRSRVTLTANAKLFRCFSCNRSFANKPALDAHVIRSCVKTPRRISTSASPTSRTSKQPPPPATAASTSRISSKSNITLKASRATTTRSSSSSSSTQSARKAPLSSRTRRIPMNAGIPVRRSRAFFQSLKRKLLEDDDAESTTTGTQH